jgi:hypothetical protein
LKRVILSYAQNHEGETLTKPKGKSEDKPVWWEKSVEYKFIADAVAGGWFKLLAPFGVSIEKYVGDAALLQAGRLYLIEYKRTKKSISAEHLKYLLNYEETVALKNISAEEDSSEDDGSEDDAPTGFDEKDGGIKKSRIYKKAFFRSRDEIKRKFIKEVEDALLGISDALSLKVSPSEKEKLLEENKKYVESLKDNLLAQNFHIIIYGDLDIETGQELKVHATPYWGESTNDNCENISTIFKNQTCGISAEFFELYVKALADTRYTSEEKSGGGGSKSVTKVMALDDAGHMVAEVEFSEYKLRMTPESNPNSIPAGPSSGLN